MENTTPQSDSETTCDTCGTNPATTTSGATIVHGRLFLDETVCDSCNTADEPSYMIAVLVAEDDYSGAVRAVEQGYADHADVVGAHQTPDHSPSITLEDVRVILDEVLPDSADVDLPGDEEAPPE